MITIVKTNNNAQGHSHWFTLEMKSQKRLKKAIKKLPKDANINSILSNQDGDDFSEDVFFNVGNNTYALSSKDGVWRVFAGGDSLSKKKTLDKMDTILALRDGKVVDKR